MKAFSLNFIENQLKKSLGNSSIVNDVSNDSKPNINNKQSMDSIDTIHNGKYSRMNDRINIKLNINSEVINNNIKINSNKFEEDSDIMNKDTKEGNKNMENQVNKHYIFYCK